MIDAIARDLAITRYGLAESLHVPIGAVDETAISTYVGEIQKVLNGGLARMALLVQAKPPPARDPRFPIWDIDGCHVLHQRLQIWVDVAYTRYERRFRQATIHLCLTSGQALPPSFSGLRARNSSSPPLREVNLCPRTIWYPQRKRGLNPAC
jgi:hypothetical protein